MGRTRELRPIVLSGKERTLKTISYILKFAFTSLIIGGIITFAFIASAEMGTEKQLPDKNMAAPTKVPLLTIFKTQYDHVINKVKDGSLPESAGVEAEDMWISVQKYMIRKNAQIEIFKLEAIEYSGTQQEEALNRLMDATAERERTLMEYIHAIGKLKGKQPVSIPLPPNKTEAAKDSPDPEREILDSSKNKKDKKRGMDIEIEIKPEDIINEEQVMD